VRTVFRHLLVLGFASAAFGIASLSTISCEGQGEGERCEHENGDQDCQPPLVCKQGALLGGQTDYCCPPTGGTKPECIGSTNQGGGGSGGGGSGGGGSAGMAGMGGGGQGGAGGGGSGGSGGTGG